MTTVAEASRIINAAFGILVAGCASTQVASVFASTQKAISSNKVNEGEPPNAAASALRRRFLAVFWLFRMADWLQGPYFYEVYASKTVNGRPISEDLVARLFLTGFGTQALLGTTIGKFVDSYGRKAASLAFAVIYSLSALSTRATSLPLLFCGRMAGGIGTALLENAPESWLVSEQARLDLPNEWLGETFGLAYLGNSIVAIVAGQLAGMVASKWGPAAPFSVSKVFLAAGATTIACTWNENKNTQKSIPDENVATSDGGSTVSESLRLMRSDARIQCVGAVQAMFESAMYVFVMQWPQLMNNVWPGGGTPFGKIFSCFMASCMLGSSTFGTLLRMAGSVERVLAGALVVAAGAMGGVCWRPQSFSVVFPCFLSFEACVGIYFPSIGTMRSKYVPESHRGVMMGLFGVPLNIIVAAVLLGSKRLGTRGSLACCTLALQAALISQLRLCKTCAMSSKVPSTN